MTSEDEDAGQLPVYYVNKTLLVAEVRYNSLEKLALALFTAVKKLRHYFETHHVVVMINYPLKSVLRKPDLAGRLDKWSISLSTMDIEYQPRKDIKLQALADFVEDFSPDLQAIADKEVEEINNVRKANKWILFVDGSSNQRGAGLGVVLKWPQEDMIARSISCDFKATNNEAEYKALIARMIVAKDLGATSLDVYSEFAAKDTKMTAYLEVGKEKNQTLRPIYNPANSPRPKRQSRRPS
uniref:Reverse transcriptase RNase H-like domain-containing protein n=1 Tax=Chenopodium quinoa TaxID=63459 RepID=A0A803N6B3_CHEQI